MSITLDELIFDPSNPDDGANVGATLRGSDGTVIGNVSDALKVDIGSVSDLDIRDLAFATDSVDVSGSEVSLDAATLAALENTTVTIANAEVEISNDVGNPIPIDDAGGSITVDAVNLDIRDLAFATDTVDASGSEVSLDAATLAALETTTVVATDLDIRDLTFATDTVDASGSEVSLDAATLAALETTTVIATDLDIRDLAFATDKVDVSGSSIEQACFQTIKHSAQAVTTTASQLAATALTDRCEITIQNLGNKAMYIGSTNAVTSATGVKIPAGGSASYNWGASADVWAISEGNSDVRLMEASY